MVGGYLHDCMLVDVANAIIFLFRTQIWRPGEGECVCNYPKREALETCTAPSGRHIVVAQDRRKPFLPPIVGLILSVCVEG